MFKNRRSMIENTRLMDDVYGSDLKPQGDPLVPHRSASWTPTAPVGEREPGRGTPLAARKARSALERTAHLAGRAIFGGYFLYNGINHFKNREMIAGYASSKNLPAADAAVIASGVMMLVGGASILAGAKPKIGAASIAGFLLAVSPTMHAYWNEQDPERRMNEMVNFTKNMALIGGALLAAGHPEPWPLHAGGGNGRAARGMA